MPTHGLAHRRAYRVGHEDARPAEDSVAVEEPLEIRVQGESVAVTMRTPGDDARLAVGFLFAEGLLAGIDDVGSVVHCGRPDDPGFGNTLEVTPAGGADLDLEKLERSRRGTLTTAACGVCGRRSIDDLLSACGRLPDGPTMDPLAVFDAVEALSASQSNFKQTGGVHAAAALDASGRVLAAFEDIGRHNAVDKVVGALVYDRRVGRSREDISAATAPTILAVSGRASFEIIQKAAVARIPIVASVSAASSLAIDLAERVNLTLACFVRGRTCNVFGSAARLTGGRT